VVSTGQRPGTVCVVTGAGDVTADRVVEELHRREVPVVRFDLAHFPAEVTLDAVCGRGGWRGEIAAYGRRVALEEIGAVWWWHPGLPQVAVPPECGPGWERWARREAAAGLGGVLSALECRHVNHPGATFAGQVKADVLVQAVRAGLEVPPTWIGNHLGGARAFAASTGGEAVCKSLTEPGITANGEHAPFFTTPVSAFQLDASLALTAHQLQRRVDKRHEVRLVMAGEEVFAARITAGSPAARRDFRADYGALAYEVEQVPGRIRDGVARLMRHYGLAFAVCDFLVGRDGGWWLVDLNPAGQWAWLEHELPGLEITGALARLLAVPASARTVIPVR
jgi:hypothetical protein